MTQTSTSPAVGRALDILTLLASHAGSVPVATLIRELGLPRSSAYHILTVLTERGFVTYVPEARAYALGPSAFRLGSAYDQHEQLERLARPVLRTLAADIGISVHLGILRGANTMYLLKESPKTAADAEPELVTAIGVLLPAHLTANGRAILAAMDAAQVRALYAKPGDFVSRTGRGPRSQAELIAALAAERERGYAEEVELVATGLRSAGAAIFDLHAQPLAAVSATWRSRVLPRDPAEIGAALREGAAEVTRRLQGRR